MKKKFFSLLLILCLLITMCGCKKVSTIEFSGQGGPSMLSISKKTPYKMFFTVKNTGNLPIENFRFNFSSKKFIDALVIVDVIGGKRRSSNSTDFSFGLINPGETKNIKIVAYPKLAGNFETLIWPKQGEDYGNKKDLKDTDGEYNTLESHINIIP